MVIIEFHILLKWVVFYSRNQDLLLFLETRHIWVSLIRLLSLKINFLLWCLGEIIHGMQSDGPKNPWVIHCKQKGTNENIGPRAMFCQKLINSVWNSCPSTLQLLSKSQFLIMWTESIPASQLLCPDLYLCVNEYIPLCLFSHTRIQTHTYVIILTFKGVEVEPLYLHGR